MRSPGDERRDCACRSRRLRIVRPVRHIQPPILRGGLTVRLVSLVVALFACAVGIVLMLHADLGLSPWDVLHQGVAERTGISFGAATIVVSVLVVVLASRLGWPIGIGTIANALLVGAFIQLLLLTDAIPEPARTGARAGYFALGLAAFGLGSGFYIGANMGAGPRDSLMLVTSRRTGARIGLSRTALEAAALGVGAALGGSIGVGTLAFAVLVGPTVELSFFLVSRSPLAVAPAPGRAAAAEAPIYAPGSAPNPDPRGAQ
jgi:uncharacterized protein